MKTKLIFALLFISRILNSQDISENKTAKYEAWALLQLVPSPTLYQDSDGKNSRLLFGFKWHITPINISFNPNKYLSPFQFFYINPVRRFTGSVELFVQPEAAAGTFKYANLSSFALSTGPRIIIPVQEMGENISVSIGGKYTYQNNFVDGKNYYGGIEGGVYFFGGLLGFQYTQNFDSRTRYNINFYFKYF